MAKTTFRNGVETLAVSVFQVGTSVWNRFCTKKDRREDEYRARHERSWNGASEDLVVAAELAATVINAGSASREVTQKYDLSGLMSRMDVLLDTARREWRCSFSCLQEIRFLLAILADAAEPNEGRGKPSVWRQCDAAKRIIELRPQAQRELDRQWRELPPPRRKRRRKRDRNGFDTGEIRRPRRS